MLICVFKVQGLLSYCKLVKFSVALTQCFVLYYLYMYWVLLTNSILQENNFFFFSFLKKDCIFQTGGFDLWPSHSWTSKVCLKTLSNDHPPSIQLLSHLVMTPLPGQDQQRQGGNQSIQLMPWPWMMTCGPFLGPNPRCEPATLHATLSCVSKSGAARAPSSCALLTCCHWATHCKHWGWTAIFTTGWPSILNTRASWWFHWLLAVCTQLWPKALLRGRLGGCHHRGLNHGTVTLLSFVRTTPQAEDVLVYWPVVY